METTIIDIEKLNEKQKDIVSSILICDNCKQLHLKCKCKPKNISSIEYGVAMIIIGIVSYIISKFALMIIIAITA